MLTRTDIKIEVEKFKSKSTKNDHRYKSFDYCYNYFYTTKNLIADVEKSCLVLGFYLASWGMFRGSSFLLQKNLKHFEETIYYISSLNKSIWNIDVDNYNEQTIETIITIYKEVKDKIIKSKSADVILITKIMLGVFGFIPAFDNYFCGTFRKLTQGNCGFRRVSKESLDWIKKFYDANNLVINELSKKTFTIDVKTGLETDIHYPKAKIIDMYGFTLR